MQPGFKTGDEGPLENNPPLSWKGDQYVAGVGHHLSVCAKYELACTN